MQKKLRKNHQRIKVLQITFLKKGILQQNVQLRTQDLAEEDSVLLYIHRRHVNPLVNMVSVLLGHHASLDTPPDIVLISIGMGSADGVLTADSDILPSLSGGEINRAGLITLIF